MDQLNWFYYVPLTVNLEQTISTETTTEEGMIPGTGEGMIPGTGEGMIPGWCQCWSSKHLSIGRGTARTRLVSVLVVQAPLYWERHSTNPPGVSVGRPSTSLLGEAQHEPASKVMVVEQAVT